MVKGGLLTVAAISFFSSALAQDRSPEGLAPPGVPPHPASAQESLVDAPLTTADPEPLSDPTATVGTQPVPDGASEPPDTPEHHETFVDRFQEDVSSGLLNTAVWLDSFFGDERHEAEANDSHFKVSSAPFFEDGSWNSYRPDYELRLVLPQLRRKTRLVISGDMLHDGEDVSEPAAGPLAKAIPPEERDVATSLQVVLPSHKRHSTTLRAGLRYHAGEFVYYLGPRYRYLLPLGTWTARFTENVIWEGQSGWKSATRIDLERPLPRDLFFRSSVDGLWTEGVTGYLYSVAFLLRQPLDPKRAIQYQWINLFQTRPVDALTEVRLVFNYRQQIWRPWLFLEIAPQYRFPRDRSFEATPGIMFRFEMVFSKERG